MSLRLKSQEDCKSILSELEGKLKAGTGSNGGAGGIGVTDEERKVALFYRAAMDEGAIEAAGTTPMTPLLELCEEAAGCRDDGVAFASSLGRMALLYGVTPFFAIGACPDKKDSDRSIAEVSQGGIRLPDRDYYFDKDKEAQRTAYKRTMALMLTLLADAAAIEPTDEAIDAAGRVYELEKSLAECESRYSVSIAAVVVVGVIVNVSDHSVYHLIHRRFTCIVTIHSPYDKNGE
jgi:putative endopeptidase